MNLYVGSSVDTKSKTMRRVGGLSIAMGIVALVVGTTIGVGCIVAGGNLLAKSDN